METTKVDEWQVLNNYFQDHMYPFTKHHLDSFREFLRYHIPKTIRTYNPITMVKYDDHNQVQLKVDVYVGGKNGKDIYIDRPVMFDSDGKPILLTPHEARLRNLTYQTNIFADLHVEYTKEDGKMTERQFPRTLLGAIPIMTHSDPCVLHGQGSDVLREFNECVYDQGGYFIIDGKEKVIVSQERITTNRLFISALEDDQDFSYKAMIRCTGDEGESSLIPRTVELYVVRNPDLMLEGDVKGEYKASKGAIYVSLPSINGKIPLTTLFRALGVESDRSIIEHIVGDMNQDVPKQFYDFLRPSLVDGVSEDKRKAYSQAEAIEYLKYRVFYESTDHVKSILVSDVFPNVKGPFHMKARFLGYLVNQLMKVCLNIQSPSDRDSYAFKRVDISGFLLAQLFQDTYNRIRKACRDALDREYYYGPWKNTGVIEDIIRSDNLNRLFHPVIMSETFIRSLKGMWGPKDADPEQGMVQDLARISYIGFLSHMRRVNLPLDRTIKVTTPHRLHAQQWGVMCPFESPDGASIGYLKNLALLTQITFGTDPSLLEECLKDLGVFPLQQVDIKVCNSKDMVKVFLNGDWFGMTDKPLHLLKVFRLYRRNGLINPFTSISWDIPNNEIRVQCEAGRPCRPLFVAKDGQMIADADVLAKQSWFDMVFGTLLPENRRNENQYYSNEYVSPFTLPAFMGKSMEEVLASLEKTQGCIEFLDIEEENTMYVAMWPKDLTNLHTHVEIHPSTIFSVVTNNIPLANHNFAPRNVFYGSQSKQAVGVYATNFTKRFDTMGYIQHYPQKPLVTTRNAHYTGNDRMPNGVNVIVAVATHTGFNQEDGLIINKNAIDRGLFQLTAYKSMSASEKKVSERESYMFANPIKLRDSGKKVDGIKHANYTLLDDNGFIPEESYIPRGQEATVLGMVHVRKDLKEQRRGVLTEQVVETSYRDVSEVTDVHHYGKIDKVFVVNKGVGNTERICKIRFRKVRRPELGDKGCSRCAQKGVVGMILPAENMPYTKDGIIPDLIINPHAFPSRMTIAHLIECVFAKLCTLEGFIGDGTVFLPFDQNAMFDKLASHGFEKYGNEIMYNGRTGEQIKTEIFLGPTFYLRLKHMVADKVHARGTGPKVLLTHQPTSGRSKAGGLRVGEMERDVILAHGMSQFVKEAMMEKADKYKWAVCKQCGTLAKYAPSRGIAECTGCQSTEVSVISTPYSFKLLMQELEAMGIQMRLSDQTLTDVMEEEWNEDEWEMDGGGDPHSIDTGYNDARKVEDLEREKEIAEAEARKQIEEEEQQRIAEVNEQTEQLIEGEDDDEELEETDSDSDDESADTDELVGGGEAPVEIKIEDELDEDEKEILAKAQKENATQAPVGPQVEVKFGGNEEEEEVKTKVINIDMKRQKFREPQSSSDEEMDGGDEFFTAP
jgi:DNA-directed RNA polymerase II subunit RPB2